MKFRKVRLDDKVSTEGITLMERREFLKLGTLITGAIAGGSTLSVV